MTQWPHFNFITSLKSPPPNTVTVWRLEVRTSTYAFWGKAVQPQTPTQNTTINYCVQRYFPSLKNGHSIWTIPLHTWPPLHTDVELTPALALLLDAKGSRLLPAGAVAGDGPQLGCVPTAPASGLELAIFTETRPALPGTQRHWETLPSWWLAITDLVLLCFSVALRMDQNHQTENIPRQSGTKK